MKNFNRKKNKIYKGLEAMSGSPLYSRTESVDIKRECLVKLIVETWPYGYAKEELMHVSEPELKQLLIRLVTLHGIKPRTTTRKDSSYYYGNEYTWN